MRLYLLASIAIVTLLGCSTPAQFTNARLTEYDKDTDYVVENKPDGFTVAVHYSKYQFLPETEIVVSACRQAVATIALEEAEKRGKKIAPITEQRIKVSTGRNELTGVTTCNSYGVAKWVEEQ